MKNAKKPTLDLDELASLHTASTKKMTFAGVLAALNGVGMPHEIHGNENDARFIVAAHEAIPALIARVRRAERAMVLVEDFKHNINGCLGKLSGDCLPGFVCLCKCHNKRATVKEPTK